MISPEEQTQRAANARYEPRVKGKAALQFARRYRTYAKKRQEKLRAERPLGIQPAPRQLDVSNVDIERSSSVWQLFEDEAAQAQPENQLAKFAREMKTKRCIKIATLGEMTQARKSSLVLVHIRRSIKVADAPKVADSGKNLLWIVAAVVIVSCLVLLACLWWGKSSGVSTETSSGGLNPPVVQAVMPVPERQAVPKSPGTSSKLWSKAAKISGTAEAGYSLARSGPSRPQIEEAKCSKLQDFMGVSCLGIALPVLVFLYNYCTGNYIKGGNSKVVLALAYCFIQVNCSIWSFLGDYWFAATTKESTPGFDESETTSTASDKNGVEEGKMVWWKKQLVCNKIDWVFAVASAVGLSGVGLFQICCSGDPWFYAPLFPLFGVAIAMKFYGVAKLAEYGETKDPNALKWHLWLHSAWHVVAVAVSLFQIYGLMVDGFATPSWLCCL